MFKLILYTAFFITAACATGDFVVLHSPDTVIFKGNEEIDQSLLKEVFTAALGFTVKQRTSWSGIFIKSPFTLPEAVVAIAVEGVDSLNPPIGKRFPLIVDEVEETTWQALSGRIEERDNDNTLVRIYLGDGLDALGQSALGELKPTPIDESSLKALNLNNEEDRKFLEEVQLLHAIAKKVPSAIETDYKPDVYWLVVSGLRPVFDLHGNNSATAKEAIMLLNNAIDDISTAFVKAYNGKVLIAAFTNNASQVRHTRSTNLDVSVRAANADVLEENKKNVESTTIESTSEESDYDTTKTILKQSQENTLDTDVETITEPSNINKDSISEIIKVQPSEMNLSKTYSKYYPAIFNIILWFCVIFFFSLLAVCITIAQMDPGRDSIIYRMTSNRMKKDN